MLNVTSFVVDSAPPFVDETSCMTCTDRQDKAIEEKYGSQGRKKVEAEKKKVMRYVCIGETNHCVYERGKEHQNDIKACKTLSHMLRYLLDVHEEEEEHWEDRFGMRILKNIRTAFDRQIPESVLIQKARHNNIMNNKAEYNC